MIDLVLPPQDPTVGWWVAAVLIAIVGAARLTRLVVHDDFPPMVTIRAWWLRVTWDEKKNDVGSWSKLATCHWCFGPWALALPIATAWISGLAAWWWLFWGWLAASYLVSILVERDEKD